ncbi:sarcosine oxidase subunit alpha [Virgibacillus phasianinus]|uniref:Sarcosine oxidase subunit alpha n=1 Tax=Virgibacillus phasianinus TaxID=2017483 RepID=A0A220U2V7_9BACI|nr:(2Fe-2S)-binding protein [Virgibacillus phasianinus]ASK62417.1 sarcosine oxidase subunit alpha [Virgibacillus phasianinus]
MDPFIHPIFGKSIKKEVPFYFNGELLKAREGQTVAAALMANGIKKLGVSRKLQQSRGLFCANGRCCSCFVSVNELDHVLSCMTLVEKGMKVDSNNGDPNVRGEKNGD